MCSCVLVEGTVRSSVLFDSWVDATELTGAPANSSIPVIAGIRTANLPEYQAANQVSAVAIYCFVPTCCNPTPKFPQMTQHVHTAFMKLANEQT
eukprot:5955565-Amphidinium_carterae.1